MFCRMHEIIPPGARGDAVIEHMTITDGGGLHAQLHGYGTRNGTYAVLKIGGRVVMSDTDMEQRTNREAVLFARGDVLIGGLGLGMIILPVLRRENVQSVTVVERNSNVIALVAPALSAHTGKKPLTVIEGDVFTWRPANKGRQFDFVYLDIWTDLCVDDIGERQRLHRRFRPYLRKGGKVTSWEYEHLSYLKQRGRWR